MTVPAARGRRDPPLTFWGTRGSIPTPGPAHRALRRQHRLHQHRRPRRPAGDPRRRQRPAPARPRADEPSATARCPPTSSSRTPTGTTFRDCRSSSRSARSGNSFCIYGAAQEGVPLEEILRPADGSRWSFPVPLDALAAAHRGHEIGEGEFEIERLSTCAPFGCGIPARRSGYRLAPIRRRPGNCVSDRQRAGRRVAAIGSARLAGAAGAVPGGRRHADSRRDVLGPDHPGARRLGPLDAASGGGSGGRGGLRAADAVPSRAGARRRRARPPAGRHPEYAAKVAPRLVVEAAAEGMGFSL